MKKPNKFKGWIDPNTHDRCMSDEQRAINWILDWIIGQEKPLIDDWGREVKSKDKIDINKAKDAWLPCFNEEPESDKEKCECVCHDFINRQRNPNIHKESICECQSDKESNEHCKAGCTACEAQERGITAQEKLEVEEMTKIPCKEHATGFRAPNGYEIMEAHNKLVKAHNALVKEVRELKKKPQGGISCGGEGFSNGGDFPIPNGSGAKGSTPITNLI